MARRGFIDLELRGHELVSTAFNRLPAVLQGKVVRPALRAGADVVRGRAQLLSPRLTGRLAGGRWTLRAATRRRGLVGVRVSAPTRGELGIPAGAKGFYPFSQEFGWRVGRQVVGPLDLGRRGLKLNRKGKFYRAYEKTAAQARQEMNAHRRKIAGKRFMHAALFGAREVVIAAVAREMQTQIVRISPQTLSDAARDAAILDGGRP